MKILLFGKNGQVGTALYSHLSSFGALLALDRHGEAGFCGDLSNFEGVSQTIRSFKPDIIINAAAYTAVDKAEREVDLAMLINAQAPAHLALEAKQANALLIHYSTDYVFDGSGDHAWLETDKPAPLNTYGRSKLEGERLIQASGCRYLIFRTSWVYAKQGQNFIKSILRLAQEKSTIQVIHDQIGAPTSADLIAEITVQAIQFCFKIKENNLYHLAPQGETSWYDYAHFIIEQARRHGAALPLKTISPILSQDYPSLVIRPLNSRLNTNKLCADLSICLPHWKKGVEASVEVMFNKEYAIHFNLS